MSMTAAFSPTRGPTTTRGSLVWCLSKIACSVSAGSLPIGRDGMPKASIHRMARPSIAAPAVECVPNVSEGRDRAVIERLADAIRSVGGVTLMNVHADADHHRAVFSFLGDPPRVEAAALTFAARAVELIDMRHHRGILVAFNVWLTTGDVAVAREIARTVRESSGGLPAVQAMGVLLASRGTAQVSMNLLDYRATSIAAVFDRVRDEARARGVGVSRSELVGVAPRAAFAGRTPASVGLAGFTPDLYLDTYLGREASGPA